MIRIRRVIGVLVLMGWGNFVFGQKDTVKHVNPWVSAPVAPYAPVANLNNGVWMKGDLHMHSRHSLDASNNSIGKMIRFALSVGMDYICITDHDNHVGGDVVHHTWADPEFKSDSLVLLYGAEWTTTRGHGNVFSSKPYDHQRLYDVRDQRDVVIEAILKQLNVHLSANHPSGKDHFGFSYDMVQSIEVWNSAVWYKNANAMMIWDDMLSSGRRLTGRGGSDSHHGAPDGPGLRDAGASVASGVSDTLVQKWNKERQLNYIGTPTTWVFATKKSAQAVVDALTNGRVSVSANPYCPRVALYADLDGDGVEDMMMGDNVRASGKPVKFRVSLSGSFPFVQDYKVKVIRNGDPFGEYTVDRRTGLAEFTDTPGAIGRTYYRVEVTGTPAAFPEVPGSVALSGDMVGLSNPLYFNFDPNF